MPITPLIHITAAYSNAVLVAILPHVSDYAKKLSLPIPQPITLSQVAHAGINNRKGRIDSGIWLTNHYWFIFNYGYVGGFRLNKHNPFNDDNPAENWPKYAFGPINMTTNEAIDFVRQSIAKLGYDVETLHAGAPPDSFSGGIVLKDGNPFPYCEMTWENKPESTNNYYIQGQVDMNRKQLIGLSIIDEKLFTTNPPISVTPELESDYRKQIEGHMFIRTNAPTHL